MAGEQRVQLRLEQGDGGSPVSAAVPRSPPDGQVEELLLGAAAVRRHPDLVLDRRPIEDSRSKPEQASGKDAQQNECHAPAAASTSHPATLAPGVLSP